jgi:ribose/xylose/arabinose/galactoside ABC-type transport system permease subunit
MSTHEGLAQGATRRSTPRFSLRHVVGSPIFLIVVLIAASVAAEPILLGERAIRNVLVGASPLLLVAAAQAIVILTKGIDLSVGSTMSLANVVAAALMEVYPDMVIPIVVLTLVGGCAIGLVNGWLVAYVGLNPFIITLAVAMAVQGLTLEILYQPGGLVTPGFAQIARAALGAIPYSAIAILLLFVLLAVVLRRTHYGVSLYAIGGNEAGARISGVPTARYKLTVYVFSGLMAAFAGLLLASRMSSGDPLVGDAFTLDSITAAVLGGTSLSGGSISLAGTFVAGVLLSVLNSFLNLQGVSPFYQWIVKGLILIGALCLDFIRKRR